MASIAHLDKVNEARDALEAAKRKLALHERSDRRGPKFYATLRELRYQAAAASVRLRLLQSQTSMPSIYPQTDDVDP
jgi:hypothetical protein